MKEGRLRLGIRNEFFFIMNVVNRWNRFPGEVVDAPFMKGIKVRLHLNLSNLV